MRRQEANAPSNSLTVENLGGLTLDELFEAREARHSYCRGRRPGL